MSFLLETIIAACILAGAAFILIGSFGLARMPDFYMRLHGPTKATTLGVGGILIASIGYAALTTGEVSVRELLVTLFLFFTAPISAHMIVKAAMHLEVKRIPATRNAPWREQTLPEADERPQ